MPKNSRHGVNKELERLKISRKKAQDKGDITEEAKICNTIGELYTHESDFSRALHYHQCELALSEGGRDQLGAAIAHRRIGECHCELGNYEEAVLHQRKHLEISKQLGNLAEEQRALATLGRTFFVHSQSEFERGGLEAKRLLRKATDEYLHSLDVCDKLISRISDKEVLEMKSRLYLNLGLVYETQSDIRNARKFMEKALGIVKELGDSSTVYKCHFDLGSLHLKEHHPSLALTCFREALSVARDKKNHHLEAEALREMGQAYAQLGDFESAKSSFKKVVNMPKAQLEQNEMEVVNQELKSVRKILHYSDEVDRVGVEDVRDKIKLYDKLGDLCCGVRAYSAALKYYGLQLNLAEAHGLEPKELSPIYVSLARTHTDCGQFSQALHYYRKELEVWKGNAVEECDTWSTIAKVNVCAGYDSKTVVEAYRKAYSLAKKADSAKRQASLCKAILKYCRSNNVPDSISHTWEVTLTRLLEAHPSLGDETSSSSEDESQGLDRLSSEPPPSLPSSESDNDEDTPPLRTGPTQTRAVAGMAVRKKSKVNKRNEKGETLLHVASINGNPALVKQLAKEGAEVNVRDHCGWTPLHEACNHGYVEVVRTLLDHGAAVDDPGGAHCGGVTPLIDASINGHVDVVRLLIEKGANIEIKNSNGETALSSIIDKLSSESGYDLEEEHRVIRDILRRERRRLGGGAEDDDHERSKVDGHERRNECSTTKVNSTQSSRPARPQQRSRLTDRTGAGVLYSSDEDDTPPPSKQLNRSLSNKQSSNPFERFTVGGDHQPGPSGTSHSNSVKNTQNSHRKGFFNPLGQVEVPALLPEDDSEDSHGHGCVGDLPVIDGWLIDDMQGGPPPAKRKRNEDGYTEQSSRSKSFVRVESSSGRRKGQLRLRKSPSLTRPFTQSRTTDRLQERSLHTQGTFNRDSKNKSIIELEFDDEFHLGSDDVMLNENFGSSISTQPVRNDFNTSSTQNTTIPQSSIATRTEHAQYITPGPLRIRVRIESKPYLIPCPKKLQDGKDTTVSWLIKQATDRYYTQEGVRPELSLTTLDGALLCPEDLVDHVLGQNEEVLGVVQQWHLPPLSERYQMACKTEGKQCHKKILSTFQSNANLSSLDLTDFDLCPRDCAPLFTSLQGQHTLTSLNLSGNRVGDEGAKLLSSALAGHPTLHMLDLSCTAVTTQGLEFLSTQKSTPSTSSTTTNTLTSNGQWAALRSLVLSFNNLGVASGCGLRRLLELTKGLQELCLEYCGLSGAAFQPTSGLVEAIGSLSSLRSLSVAGNTLGVDGVSSLLNGLPIGLSKLNLSGTCANGPSIVGCFHECEEHFTKVSKLLESLNISLCSVTDSCLPELAAILKGCGTLRELNLAGNSITGNALHPLCRFLSVPALSPKIQALDLSGHHEIGVKGTEQLLSACIRRKSLEHSSQKTIKLSLCGCGLESPLPESLISSMSDLVIATNLSVLLKLKQTHNKFVVLLELDGNLIDSTDLLLMSSEQS